VYFCTLCPSIGPKERSRQALDRLPPVSNFLTNFWTQHFEGARLSPNSVPNAVWHALNEPVCQYLRTRNPRCSTVYIDNSLGPLARDSPCTSMQWGSCYCLCDTAQIFNFGADSVIDLTFVVCCCGFCVCVCVCVSWRDWRCRRNVGMAPPINNFGTMEVTDQLHAPALYSREKKRGRCLSPSNLYKDLQ